jgi:hypothetical protein
MKRLLTLAVMSLFLSGDQMTAQNYSSDPLLHLKTAKIGKELEDRLALASDDADRRKERTRDAIRIGSRRARVSYLRAAANTDFSRRPDGDNQLNAYRNLGFNTVVLSDQLGHDENGTWTYMTDEQIQTAVLQARKYNMNIIVSIIANHFTVGEVEVPALSAEEVKERFSKWVACDRGDIIGVYLLGDDNFLILEPVENLRAWRLAVREVLDDVAVLGLMGEFCLLADAETRDQFFAPDTFDHMLLTVYPYNLSNHPVYGPQIIAQLQIKDPSVVALDNVTSVTPNGDQLRYLNAYFALVEERFTADFYPSQRIIPIVEAFEYVGEGAGKFPVPEDIETAVETSVERVREIFDDDGQWSAVTMFQWGAGEDTFPAGLAARPLWWDAVKFANTDLELSTKIVLESCLLSKFVLGIR